MVSIFATDTATEVLSQIEEEMIWKEQFNATGTWLNLVNPTDKEIERIVELTEIPEQFLKAALDEEERAHIDVDGDVTLFLVDLPILEDEDDYYSYATIPLGIIRTSSCLVTVCLKDTAVLRDFSRGRIKTFHTAKKTRFMLQIMYNTAVKYLQYLRQIDKMSQRVQSELHKSMKNKELIQLLTLENSLVYFSTSLKANEAVIRRIYRTDVVKKYEEDKELLEDVLIETEQAIEMATIYRDILSGTMDAFASVISNNLNIVMRALTALTVIISVPTFIASLFGMNVPVPWGTNQYGFWIVLAICLATSMAAAWALFKKKKLK